MKTVVVLVRAFGLLYAGLLKERLSAGTPGHRMSFEDDRDVRAYQRQMLFISHVNCFLEQPASTSIFRSLAQSHLTVFRGMFSQNQSSQSRVVIFCPLHRRVNNLDKEVTHIFNLAARQ